jgi:SAM-dependent methyltransferase
VTQPISFDRAADYYDRTRALDPESQAAVTRLLVVEIEGRDPVLELGIGTGRIGLPVAQAGIDLAGIDISPAMLRRLRANSEGISVPAVCADATRLPFANGSFGAAYACHVLHLIPDWPAVLAEVVRAVRPGGVFLNDIGGWRQETGPWMELLGRFAAEAGFELRPPGTDRSEEVDQALAGLGATPRALATIPRARDWTYEETVRSLEEGLWSLTWQVDEPTRRRAAAATREWAEQRFGGLSQSFTSKSTISWRAYDL